MKALDILKMVKGSGDLQRMAVTDPVSYAGQCIKRVADYLPNDSTISILKDNLPLLIGLADNTPAFQAGFDAWLNDCVKLRAAANDQ